jgi:hypothetical protein
VGSRREADGGIGLDLVALRPEAPLREFVRDTAVDETDRDGSSSRIASSATVRIATRSLACSSGPNSRWCSASASSISVFFGSTARSVTPKRSAALRLATP